MGHARAPQCSSSSERTWPAISPVGTSCWNKHNHVHAGSVNFAVWLLHFWSEEEGYPVLWPLAKPSAEFWCSFAGQGGNYKQPAPISLSITNSRNLHSFVWASLQTRAAQGSTLLTWHSQSWKIMFAHSLTLWQNMNIRDRIISYCGQAVEDLLPSPQRTGSQAVFLWLFQLLNTALLPLILKSQELLKTSAQQHSNGIKMVMIVKDVRFFFPPFTI